LRAPIVEEEVCVADREADILVREGRALPKYEDAPDYVGAPLYKELLNSETSEAYGSTQTGVAFTADTQ